MNEPTAHSDDSITEAAAHWCMRLHADDCSAQEREAFAQWLSQDPAHASEFRAMQDIWSLSAHLPKPAAPAMAARPRRRRWLARAVAAAVVALPLAGLLGWSQNWLPSNYHRYGAEAALQTVALPDGSEVQLNLNSAISFANYRDQRQVTLRSGEAFFKVHHDASHPFVVLAGTGSVTVTGTQFNVWTYQGQVVVTLTEGSVKVLSDVHQPDQVAYLTPGMQARYDASEALPEISRTDPQRALAWRNGQLILDDLTLAEALPRINRYLPVPARLGDNAAGNLRIGGIYNTRNANELLRVLPRVLPVSLSLNTEGATVINSRQAPKG